MQIRVGMENGMQGRSLAWALDHPGCFNYGRDATEAVVGLPRALLAYKAWMESSTPQPWLAAGDFDVRVSEVFDGYAVDEHMNRAEQGRRVQAWFQDDWRLLTTTEVERGRLLLEWARRDLLELGGRLSAGQLTQQHPGERWTVGEVFGHVATAQWWLLDRLDLAPVPRASLPEEPFERLQATQALAMKVLPGLAGLEKVTGKQGEFWSPRKVLRRMVWHERDHLEHILKLTKNPGE